MYGHLECVRSLVEAGADKNIADNDGFKPINYVCNHFQANKKNEGAIKALLR